MKLLLFFLLTVTVTNTLVSQTKTIHVFVALCDNKFQGIVPVPESLGDGKDPKHNLYWGAAYGVKSYFKTKTSDWQFVSTLASENPNILDRVLFKHATKNVFILADAYDGEQIKTCTEEFLKTSNGQLPINIPYKNTELLFGGHTDLAVYIGHDGLMEFSVNLDYNATSIKKDVIILACYSQSFFKPHIQNANANPLLWTTHLMAPEAYTLKAAIDGWIINASGQHLKERAAQTYNTYQKCGLRGARNLFTTGF